MAPSLTDKPASGSSPASPPTAVESPPPPLSPTPSKPKSTKPHETFDIEHVPVDDDPRQWSPLRKNTSLILISAASMIAGLGNSIQNPAVKEMQDDLPATSSQFSWSISTFILVQGLFPLVWTAISEIKGRKLVYLTSLLLFTVGSIVVAISNSIGLVIGFRCFQAAGSSAVISIGAATLADIFEPAERGTKMGIYYMAPLLGPSLGPIFGGALTTGFNWRAIFWFLTVVSGSSFVAFVLLFKDTFRKERSLTYQNALRQRMEHAAKKGSSRPVSRRPSLEDVAQPKASNKDVEKADTEVEAVAIQEPRPNIKVSLKDLSPIRPIGLVLRRKNNTVVLFASGLLFAYGLMVPYTSARTLSASYNYEALKIGLVILSYGIGSMVGSFLGGRWSDHQLARLKRENGGVGKPEMRLHSITAGAILLPPFTIAFGWVCRQHVHVAAVCVFLFCCGFLSIWIYASTLAYIVDANNGRSSSAVACNSAFRGVFAFIAIEIAVPMQDHLGDGWMYTIWGGIMAISGSLIFLVSHKGEKWREEGEASERNASQ